MSAATQSSAYGQPSLSRSSHQDRQEEDPMAAMSSYQRYILTISASTIPSTKHTNVKRAQLLTQCENRIMHEHTRQQFETATASSRRRSVQSNDDDASSADRKASLQSESSVESNTSS
jgi:hypothetical protein